LLTQDIFAPDSSINCVLLKFASYRTLDCQSFSIIGKNGGRGVYAMGGTNIKIINCKFSNFTYGIRASSSLNISLENLVSKNNVYGISINTPTYIPLKNIISCSNFVKDIIFSSIPSASSEIYCDTSTPIGICQKSCSQISPPTEYCGDAVCNNGENCSTCSDDCGTCAVQQYCGDAVCNNGENCSTCSDDCGNCPATSICTDSDGGKNYTIRGTMTNNSGSVSDFCSIPPRDVIEFYCLNGGSFVDYHDCSSEGKICKEGACTFDFSTNLNCSQFGYQYQSGIISYCNSNVNSYDLSSCYNRTLTCTDYDGNNFYEASNVTFGSSTCYGSSCGTGSGCSGGAGNSPDSCLNQTTLQEKICNSTKGVESVLYNCASEGKVCQDGRCVAQVTCNDSDGGLDYYEKGITNWTDSLGERHFATDSCGAYFDDVWNPNTLTEHYCNNSNW